MSTQVVRGNEMPKELTPATPDAASIMAVISRAASDPNTDVVKLEKLLDMFERINAKQAESEFNAAMTKAQARTRRVAADAVNPQTRSKYASYAALDKVLRPIYTEEGFSLSFDTGKDAPAECVRVVCYVAHNSGHTRTYHADMPADGKGAKGGDVMTKTHAVGSAMQYGMRYLLKMIFNVAVGDDDGNAASGAGMPEGQRADYESAIESLIDRPAGEKLWKLIAKACKETKDKAAYDSLKEKMFAKLKSFEGKGVKK